MFYLANIFSNQILIAQIVILLFLVNYILHLYIIIQLVIIFKQHKNINNYSY